MNQALYRKYRSKSFGEVVGQEHVTKTLQQALKTGRISHAYLFTGPRGVGKTSVARILAHEVNGLPYNDESTHLDIIEIDAASNRRIDEIRDLREKVRIAPAVGKYKVYIIDEVHMLTREAFNALLKTLEEPPAHAIFILATTEAHKLPETIISRTQRFEFKPVGTSQAASHLHNIAQAEKIEIDSIALNLLAEFGNGSFRDSISFLDQLSSAGPKITEDDVRKTLGLPSAQQIDSLLGIIDNGNPRKVIEIIQSLRDHGIDAASAAGALAKKLRDELAAGNQSPVAIKLLKQLIDVPASSKPYDFLEISLLEACEENKDTKSLSSDMKATGSSDQRASPKAPTKSASSEIPHKSIDKSVTSRSVKFHISEWPQIVKDVREKDASIFTALRLAEPEYSDGVLLLKFQFPLHQKKLNQAKNKALISELIEDLTGDRVEVESVVDKQVFTTSSNRVVKENLQPKDNPMHSINNIFGAAEVLET